MRRSRCILEFFKLSFSPDGGDRGARGGVVGKISDGTTEINTFWTQRAPQERSHGESERQFAQKTLTFPLIKVLKMWYFAGFWPEVVRQSWPDLAHETATRPTVRHIPTKNRIFLCYSERMYSMLCTCCKNLRSSQMIYSMLCTCCKNLRSSQMICSML